jgi:hypothetical protein
LLRRWFTSIGIEHLFELVRQARICRDEAVQNYLLAELYRSEHVAV